MKDEILTTSEINLKTGIPPKTINKWFENGYIQIKDIKGRNNLFSLLDVVQYNKAHPIKNRSVVWDRIVPRKDEDFRLLVGYDDRYAVSKYRIVNFTTGEVLDPKPAEDGYIHIALQKDGERIYKYAHCLTSELFCPNKRRDILPDANWETHHINVGFEHRKDINPDNLLPLTVDEHRLLHKLWNNNKKKEYWKMIELIKKQNDEEWHKIPHPDYEPDEYNVYYMFLNDKGYEAYINKREIPFDTILCESVERKGEID